MYQKSINPFDTDPVRIEPSKSKTPAQNERRRTAQHPKAPKILLWEQEVGGSNPLSPTKPSEGGGGAGPRHE